MKDRSGTVTGVLTEKDADRFEVAAKEYTEKVTSSKQAAREALVKLGTHTPTGRIAKNYK